MKKTAENDIAVCRGSTVGAWGEFRHSEVEYVNTHTPVKIKCRQCGVVFMQEPASHLAGSDRLKCGKKTVWLMSQEVFIARAMELHDDTLFHTHTTSEWHR